MIQTDLWNFWDHYQFCSPLLSHLRNATRGYFNTSKSWATHKESFGVFFSKKKVLRFFEEMLKRKVWETKKKAHLESKQLLMLG